MWPSKRSNVGGNHVTKSTLVNSDLYFLAFLTETSIICDIGKLVIQVKK